MHRLRIATKKGEQNRLCVVIVKEVGAFCKSEVDVSVHNLIVDSNLRAKQLQLMACIGISVLLNKFQGVFHLALRRRLCLGSTYAQHRYNGYQKGSSIHTAFIFLWFTNSTSKMG